MNTNREAIIAEYLTGDYSYRQLGVKHGIDFRKQEPDLGSSVELKRLEAELRKAKLHNEVLEEMLKLSEQLTGIELRKKFGTKQS